MRKAKALVFLLSVRIGTPRYLPKSLQDLMFSSLSTALIIFGDECGEKYILDFEKIIFWPDRDQKVLRMFFYGGAVFFARFGKKDKIVGEEKVRESWAIS